MSCTLWVYQGAQYHHRTGTDASLPVQACMIGRGESVSKYAAVRRFLSVSMLACGVMCFSRCLGTQHLLCCNSCSNWRCGLPAHIWSGLGEHWGAHRMIESPHSVVRLLIWPGLGCDVWGILTRVCWWSACTRKCVSFASLGGCYITPCSQPASTTAE